MTPQLERLGAELADAQRGIHQLADTLSAPRWASRPARDEWSVAECIAHLNLTSQAFLPLLDEALARGRAAAQGGGRYRMDLTGWLLWVMTVLRVPVKTTDPFVPKGPPPRDAALAEFDTLQDALARRLERAEGLDLMRLRIVSPFNARARYNVYAAFRLITGHQRLHLRQAERAARQV